MYAQKRRIWIDAICVNQSDIDERNEQVRLMRRIYTETSRCFVWLGQFSEEEVKLGIEALMRLEQHRRADEISTKVDPFALTKSINRWIRSSPAIESLEALKALVESPWFSRVWVIQEITFPPCVTILYGYTTLDWDFTIAALDHVGMLSLYLRDTAHADRIRGLNTVRSNRVEMSRRGGINLTAEIQDPWWKMLIQFRGFEATDPRDNVFALMSLVDIPDDGMFSVPDYHMAEAEVYRLFTKKMLCWTKSLEPLIYGISSAPGGRQTRGLPARLPSWVVNWREALCSRPLTGRNFKAARSSLLDMEKINSCSDRLVLEGYPIDEITYISAPSPYEQSNVIGVPQRLEDWKSGISEFLSNSSLPSLEFDAAFYRTIMGGASELHSDRLDVQANEVGQIVSEYLALRDTTSEAKGRWVEDNITEARFVAYTIVSGYISSACTRRRLTATTRQRIGLVPDNAEVGDSVFLLKGSDTPFVLRRKEEHTWLLIGHCYVDGVMYGEVFHEDACLEVILA
ncbi:hypothetical protein ONS96_003909 [Cadophora gregata f. sp. sojae]|nr:hypothetical protein ONS96_003909 [Cadophora gregata f. sp. sojae]